MAAHYGYDKVIMLAGGVGYADAKRRSQGRTRARTESSGFGGDNYQSRYGWRRCVEVDTGSYANAIELNAVQRANPEMQKRVSNVIARFGRIARQSYRVDPRPRCRRHPQRPLNSLKPPAAQLT